MQAVDTDGNGRITYQGGCLLSDRIARVLTRIQNSANSYTKPKRSFSTCSRPSTTTTTARSPRTSCAQLCERPASQCPTVISTSSSRKWTPTMMGPSVLKNGGMYPVDLRLHNGWNWSGITHGGSANRLRPLSFGLKPRQNVNMLCRSRVMTFTNLTNYD